ncbi:MAG: hypothetical protein H0X28_12505 [Solirubrobacterales bacterium]|nr:hypothetical protein [Solirubrobacterales bacterium]
MSSVPTERRTLQPRTPMIRVDLRVLAVVAAACVGLFALSFLAGRALSPGRGGHSVTLPEVAATQASGEIPVRLSVAPPLKLATPVVTVLHTSAPKSKSTPAASSSTTSPPSALPVLTQPSPAPPPAAPVVVQPPAAVTQPPAKTPVTTQSAPAAKSNSGGGSAAPKGGGGGGVSFDSSG